MPDQAVESPSGVRLQTLERGLDVLDLLADGAARSVAEIAVAAGLHRSIAYRIVRTLEDRAYLEREPDGRYRMGVAVATLARGVRTELGEAAGPELADLADETGATAFLVVPSGGEAVTLLSVEPRRSRAHVSHRPGQRHPLDRGAPGLAILAAGPPLPEERAEVEWARQTGYVRTTGEVIPGLSALATPLRFADGSTAALCLVFLGGDLDETAAADHLRRRADRLTALVSRSR
ncbi:MAG: IclR family transcriptional regulator [Sporichthyaceae bacterium]